MSKRRPCPAGIQTEGGGTFLREVAWHTLPIARSIRLLRSVALRTPMLKQWGGARCGIVRHRRCLNPRLPRSTPSAYSRGGPNGSQTLSTRRTDTVSRAEGWRHFDEVSQTELRRLSRHDTEGYQTFDVFRAAKGESRAVAHLGIRMPPPNEQKDGKKG